MFIFLDKEVVFVYAQTLIIISTENTKVKT